MEERGGSSATESGWRSARRLMAGTPFRLLVAGQMVGQAADGLIQITFAQVVLFEAGRGATPWEITKLLAVSLVPFSLVGPFAGVLIDRFDRRRVLVTMSLVRSTLGAASIAIVAAASQPLSYLAILVLLSSSRFILAAKGAALPVTVGERDLVTANAISSIGGMVAAFAGAVLGSTFVAVVPSVGAIAAAAAYLGAAGLFGKLPWVGGGAALRLGTRLRRVAAELVDGLSFAARTAVVRTPLLAMATYRILLGVGFVVLVLVADYRYDLEAPGYGTAFAVTGVGAFLGTWLAPILVTRWRRRSLLPLAFYVGAAAALVGATAPSLIALVGCVGLVALAFQVLKVIVDSLVQEGSPDSVRGRVFSIYDMLYNVAFVGAALLLVPAWVPGRESTLLRLLALAFLATGGVLDAALKSWPWRRSRHAAEQAPRRWPKRFAASVVGALPALAFPAADLWPLGFIGLVPMLWLLADAATPAEAAWRGWLGGAGFIAATHQWLIPATGFFTIPAALLIGVLWVPWALAARRLLRHRTRFGLAVAAAVVPAAFVLTEYVRSWDLLGGAWGLLGATQWSNHLVLPLAAAGGVWLMSAFLVAANVIVYTLLHPGQARPVRTLALGLAGLLALSLIAASTSWTEPDRTGVMRIGGVQAGVIHDEAERFATHETLSAELSGTDLDLVVWAESSVGFDLQSHPEYAARLQALAGRLGAPILVNVDARRNDTGGIAKAAVLIGADGISSRYDKMRLVPFGEYVPFRSVLGWVADVSDAAAEDRIEGDRLVVMDAGGWKIGPLVCFESAFPDLSRVLTDLGAQVVVVQTATTTFQGSWAQPQHASLAALRAVESGRAVVHASVSGVTAAFDARGRSLLWLEDGVVGAWVADVPVTEGLTLYVALGDWVPLLAMLTLLASLLGSGLRAARRSRDGERVAHRDGLRTGEQQTTSVGM